MLYTSLVSLEVLLFFNANWTVSSDHGLIVYVNVNVNVYVNVYVISGPM